MVIPLFIIPIKVTISKNRYNKKNLRYKKKIAGISKKKTNGQNHKIPWYKFKEKRANMGVKKKLDIKVFQLHGFDGKNHQFFLRFL